MGFFSDVAKAMDDYGRRHKQHMVQQWEKQAEKAKAEEPKPLTDTQLTWQKLQQERTEQDQHQLRPQGPAAPAAPLYTITWQIRLTSLSNIPLPWAAN